MDLRTGRAFPIATTYNEFSKPAISGSLVAWASENKDCPECDMDVYARHLATGETILVATGAAIQYAPVVSGTTVAWIEKSGETTVVVVRDLASGPASTRLDNVPGEPQGAVGEVALNAEYVVWTRAQQAAPNSHYTIRSMSRKSGEARTVVQHAWSGLHRLAVAGDLLVTASPDHAQNVTIINLSTNERLAIPGTRSGADYPALVATVTHVLPAVFWSVRSVLDETTSIYGYSITGESTESIFVDSGRIHDLAISGDRLLYIKDGKLTSKRISEVLVGR
jgi:hypothetical protein